MNNLFVLMGLPGAGKSTFANSLLNIKNDIKYISSDELRKEFVEYKDNHREIFRIMHQRTLEYLHYGKNVIYDSTNLERKYRMELYQKIKMDDLSTRVIIVFIHNGLEKAIEQSKQRKNRLDVNEQLIKNMYETIQIPIVGIDCDVIMIPTILKKKDMFEIQKCDFYGLKAKDKFCEYINEVDSKLLQLNLEVDKSKWVKK